MLATDDAVLAARLDVQAALGAIPADLLLKNCRLVNVWSEETYVTDIAVRGTRIVALRQNFPGAAEHVIDCSGRYAMPGFVEPIAASSAPIDDDIPLHTLLAHGITSVVLSAGAPTADAEDLPIRFWRCGEDRGGWETVGGKARPLQSERPCATLDEAAAAIEQGSAAVLDGGHLLLHRIAESRMETRHLMLRHRGVGDSHAAPFTVRPIFALAMGAGMAPHRAVQLTSFNAATHYGIDHEVGSITPGRKADILLYDDLADARPACVIVDGLVRNPGG